MMENNSQLQLSFPEQCRELYETLKKRSLTSLEWCNISGSTKLTSRVSDLRAAGIIVKDKWERLPSGKEIKRYWISNEQDEK